MERRTSWMMPVALALLAGCMEPVAAPLAGDANPQPISVQMLRSSPELKRHRFLNVLNFETRSDEVFVSGSNLRTRLDSARAHTGRVSLQLAGGNESSPGGSMDVKLSSLLGSKPFPGEWTLAGGYFYTEAPARMTIRCQIGGVAIAEDTVTLYPGQWTPAMVDLGGMLDPANPPSGPAMLSFSVDPQVRVWCDDLMLVDNTEWIVGRAESAAAGKWFVCRRGLGIVCGTPGDFAIRLTTDEQQSGGWRLEEANIFRARFSSTGSNQSLTILPDGRSYWDGEFRALSSMVRAEPLWARQQDSPAQIDIPESMGRIERRSAGDANNDGYNESRAAYTIVATGPRLQLTILPRSAPVLEPMLEISGLPMGDVLVTVEGLLIEKTLRLADDTLLVQLPGRLDRPTTVNLRVQ